MYFVGLDLGGTSIKAGVVSSDGKVLTRLQQRVGDTAQQRSSGAVVRLLYECAQRVTTAAKLNFHQIQAIGIGSPGIIDSSRGIVVGTANYKSWSNVPITDMLSKLCSLPVSLDNDANAAVYAEVWVGAASNAANVVMVTLGTGIGGGILSNGNIVRGAEVGHSIFIPHGRLCGCGQRGCWERYASGKGVVTTAKEDSAIMQQFSAENPVSAKGVFDLARSGHAAAGKVIDQWAEYMAIGLLNLTRAIDPQVLILGGGLAQNPGVVEMISRHFQALTWRFQVGNPPVVLAQVRNDAGLIGAAYVGKMGNEVRRAAKL